MSGDGAGRRVLLAEDSLVSQKIAVRMLEHLGFEVDAVADGRAAVDAARAVAYDVVLMDCQMPVMDGYEATAEIRRAEDEGPHTHIIAMTASDNPEDVDKALAAGMDGYLSKPVTLEELAASLAGALDRKPNARSSRRSTPDGPALDPAVIASLKELDSDTGTFFTEFMEAFLEGTDARLEELGRAVAEDNWQGRTAALVHSLKGSCGSAGALSSAAICREIEETLQTADRSHATMLVADLRTELTRVRAELARELGSDPVPETDVGG